MSQNYFELFNLDTKYSINKSELDEALFKLQSKYHPDKNPNTDFLETSQTLNLAYKVLKSDFSRAEHLLILKGFDLINQKLDDQFLLETFEWREQLDNKDDLPKLKDYVKQNTDKTLLLLGNYLEKELYDQAKNEYIRLKFLKRFLEEIEKALMK